MKDELKLKETKLKKDVKPLNKSRSKSEEKFGERQVRDGKTFLYNQALGGT